jgi:two-component system OmpR family response regulator
LSKIMIVEDDVKIARVLELELQHEHYDTVWVENGSQALNLLESEDWDLVLLDVMIPGLSGLEVLRRYRMRNSRTPVILLTARNSVLDKVNGLDHGANDYITKPFNIEELLARIRAALRTGALHTGKSENSKKHEYALADLLVNTATRQVTRGGKPIELTKREFDLLCYLLKNKRIVLNREQLLNEVWGFEYAGDTNVVDVYIGYLRKKIDHGHETALIHTVRGVGYTMKETG